MVDYGDEYTQIKTDDLAKLRKRDEKLAALEAGGVSSWEWHWSSLQDWIKEYHLDEDYFKGV